MDTERTGCRKCSCLVLYASKPAYNTTRIYIPSFPSPQPQLYPPLVAQGTPPLQPPSQQRSPSLPRLSPAKESMAPLPDKMTWAECISRSAANLNRAERRMRRYLREQVQRAGDRAGGCWSYGWYGEACWAE
jgi:hypothetical protein